MVMVDVDSGSLQLDSQSKSSGLALGWRPLGAVLHSSNERVNSRNGSAMMTISRTLSKLTVMSWPRST